MNLNCALLHADAEMAAKLQNFIGKIPFLTLCGCYTEPLRALKEYYAAEVDVYVLGLTPVSEGEIGGMEFCRMLSTHTRVIFVADTAEHAADCFRLDALDYLAGDFGFSTFFQAANKAMRWFTMMKVEHAAVPTAAPPVNESDKVFYLRSGSRILRMPLEEICYIESCGDYVKIHCCDGRRPLLNLCTMKFMEEKLPADEFVRIHRSYIVRLRALDAIGTNAVYVGTLEIPIGDAYRDRLKACLSRLTVW